MYCLKAEFSFVAIEQKSRTQGRHHKRAPFIEVLITDGQLAAPLLPVAEAPSLSWVEAVRQLRRATEPEAERYPVVA